MLDGTEVLTLEIRGIILNNLEKSALNYRVLELNPSAFVLERIPNSNFFMLASVEIGPLAITIDQSLFDLFIRFSENF